jgi:hypothetical protein
MGTSLDKRGVSSIIFSYFFQKVYNFLARNIVIVSIDLCIIKPVAIPSSTKMIVLLKKDWEKNR